MKTAVVLALLVVPGIDQDASRWEPRPGTVVVTDRPGASDTISFRFEPSTPEPRARTLVRRLLAETPVESRELEREDRADEEALRLEVTTTLATDTGPLRWTVPRDLLAPLDGAEWTSEVVLVLQDRATVLQGDVRQVEAGSHPAFRLVGQVDVTYAIPLAAVAWPLAILLLLLVIPLPALRTVARWIQRRPLPGEDKVHRLQWLSMGAMLVLSAVMVPLLVLGRLFQLPELLLSELAPTLTRSGGVLVAAGMVFFWVVFVAVVALAVLGVQPVYREVRGIERDRRDAMRKLRRALPFLLLFPAWFAVWWFLIGVDAGGWIVALRILLFAAFVGILSPYSLLLALDTYRLPDPARERLLRLAREQGLRVCDVRGMRARRQKMANAVFLGVLPWVRYIVVSDHLLEEFEEDEVEAVVAHEIGHGKGHHLLVKMGGIFLAWIVAAGLLALVLSLFDLLGDVSPLAVVVALPIMFGLAVVLVHGGIGVRLERRADEFAARVVGTDAMIRALERLAEVNMLKRKTGFLWNLLTQHPGIHQRVEHLRELAVRETGDVRRTA